MDVTVSKNGTSIGFQFDYDYAHPIDRTTAADWVALGLVCAFVVYSLVTMLAVTAFYSHNLLLKRRGWFWIGIMCIGANLQIVSTFVSNGHIESLRWLETWHCTIFDFWLQFIGFSLWYCFYSSSMLNTVQRIFQKKPNFATIGDDSAGATSGNGGSHLHGGPEMLMPGEALAETRARIDDQDEEDAFGRDKYSRLLADIDRVGFEELRNERQWREQLSSLHNNKGLGNLAQAVYEGADTEAAMDEIADREFNSQDTLPLWLMTDFFQSIFDRCLPAPLIHIWRCAKLFIVSRARAVRRKWRLVAHHGRRTGNRIVRLRRAKIFSSALFTLPVVFSCLVIEATKSDIYRESLDACASTIMARVWMISLLFVLLGLLWILLFLMNRLRTLLPGDFRAYYSILRVATIVLVALVVLNLVGASFYWWGRFASLVLLMSLYSYSLLRIAWFPVGKMLYRWITGSAAHDLMDTLDGEADIDLISRLRMPTSGRDLFDDPLFADLREKFVDWVEERGAGFSFQVARAYILPSSNELNTSPLFASIYDPPSCRDEPSTMNNTEIIVHHSVFTIPFVNGDNQPVSSLIVSGAHNRNEENDKNHAEYYTHYLVSHLVSLYRKILNYREKTLIENRAPSRGPDSRNAFIESRQILRDIAQIIRVSGAPFSQRRLDEHRAMLNEKISALDPYFLDPEKRYIEELFIQQFWIQYMRSVPMQEFRALVAIAEELRMFMYDAGVSHMSIKPVLIPMTAVTDEFSADHEDDGEYTVVVPQQHGTTGNIYMVVDDDEID